MKKFWFMMALCASVSLVACGDDGEAAGEGATADAGDMTDTGMDGSGDADAGAGETDADDDTGTEPDTAGPEDEVCGDGEDNDGDGDIDCADEDCASGIACQEDNAGACADGEDNDADGATDCDDEDCAAFCAECEEGFSLVDGQCVQDFADETEYTISDYNSFVNRLAIPPAGTPAECCFDFNGDDEVDNALAALVDLLGGLADLDVEQLLGEVIEDDTIAIMMEWTRWPEEADFSLWLGTNDVDGDGAPDQEFSVRDAGDGIFNFETEVFGPNGSILQFNQTTFEDGELDAGPSLFQLALPTEELLGTNLEVTISNARITATMAETDGAIASVTEDLSIDPDDPAATETFGGAELGGVILMDEVFGIIDQLARDCTCAGIDPASAVLEFGDDGETYNASCVQTPDPEAMCGEDDGIICEQIGLVCQFAGSIPSLIADVDVNGNEVNDALSVGIRLGWVGATINGFEVEAAE